MTDAKAPEFDPESMLVVTLEQHAILERAGAPIDGSILQPDGTLWINAGTPVILMLKAMREMRKVEGKDLSLADLLTDLSDKAFKSKGKFQAPTTTTERQEHCREVIERFNKEQTAPSEVFIVSLSTVSTTSTHEKKNLAIYACGSRLGLLETIQALLEAFAENYETIPCVEKSRKLLADYMRSEGVQEAITVHKEDLSETMRKSPNKTTQLH